MTPLFTYVKSSSNLLSNFKQSLIFILTQSKLCCQQLRKARSALNLYECAVSSRSLKLATLIKLYKLLKNSRLIKRSWSTTKQPFIPKDSKQLWCWVNKYRWMVEDDGIEPTTPCLQSRCSPSWANPPWSKTIGRDGGSGWSRTNDPRLIKTVL